MSAVSILYYLSYFLFYSAERNFGPLVEGIYKETEVKGSNQRGIETRGAKTE